MEKYFLQFVGLLLLSMFLAACNTDEPIKELNSGLIELCEAIADEDEEIVSEKINEMCSDLLPTASDSDVWGHEQNLNTVIDRLNQADCMVASLGCYACIFTLPPISEINIVLPSSERVFVLDIRTSDDGVMLFTGMH